MYYLKTEQIECIVCKKEYPRRLKSRIGRSSRIYTRGKNTITCSPKCARIYSRKYYQIRKKYFKRKGKKAK